MADPNVITRVLFEDFASSAITTFYVIAFGAIAVFCFGVYVQVRKYRRGAPAELGGQVLLRLRAMIGTVLSHRTIARRDRAAGAAHRLIFYGFVLLFLGTATITLDYDIHGPLFGAHFWHGSFYPSSTTPGPTGSPAIRITTVAPIAGKTGLSYGRY